MSKFYKILTVLLVAAGVVVVTSCTSSEQKQQAKEALKKAEQMTQDQAGGESGGESGSDFDLVGVWGIAGKPLIEFTADNKFFGYDEDGKKSDEPAEYEFDGTIKFCGETSLGRMCAANTMGLVVKDGKLLLAGATELTRM